MLQLSCETDFVSRTKDFQDTLKILMRTFNSMPTETADNNDIDGLLSVLVVGDVPPKYANKNVKEILAQLSSNTLENCSINNVLKRKNQPGIVVGTYVHGEIPSESEILIGTKAGIVVRI